MWQESFFAKAPSSRCVPAPFNDLKDFGRAEWSFVSELRNDLQACKRQWIALQLNGICIAERSHLSITQTSGLTIIPSSMRA